MDATQQEFVLVSGLPTYILKHGAIGGVPERGILQLIIPGNPGVADYYDTFMKTLYKASGEQIPVWCVSHAGHVPVPSDMNDSSSDNLHTLQGQIRHKVNFIREHIPTSTKLVLIGHSIGCYMIIRMLEQMDQSRVLKCLLLFPTIEKLQSSPKGRYVTPTLKYLRWMAPWLIYPASYLVPETSKLAVIKWYFGKRNVPYSAVKATAKLADPSVIGHITELANEEMQTVLEADYHLIEKFMDKLMFYYGQSDHWCPVEYYEDMAKKYPEADIYFCKEGFQHAFVLESGAEMAHWLWDWLRSKVPEIKN